MGFYGGVVGGRVERGGCVCVVERRTLSMISARLIRAAYCEIRVSSGLNRCILVDVEVCGLSVSTRSNAATFLELHSGDNTGVKR